MSSQEEPVEDSVAEVVEVSAIPKEDPLSPAADGSGHPNIGLARPVGGVPEAAVPEVF